MKQFCKHWFVIMVMLATAAGASAATTIIVTVSNTPPVYAGDSILITGSAMYSSPFYPVSGATTTLTLGGFTNSTHTIAGGTYSASMAPLAAGVYTARVHITDTSVSGSNSLVITVLAVKSNQTIAFPAIEDQVETNTVKLSATASSGLSVSFAVGSGPASIAGGTNLTFTGTGGVSIVASQAGNGNWNPAPNVTNTFAVTSPMLPLEILTTSLPPGLAGTSYDARLEATNGMPPYMWSGDMLPEGLSCSSNGVISGTPAQAATSLVTLAVQDSIGASTNKNLEIVILPAPAVPAPPVPGTATETTGTGFSANWAASPTATNYFLDVSADSSFSNLLADFDNLPVGDVLSWPVTGLSPGQTFYYRVRAQNGNGISENSDVVSVPLSPYSGDRYVSEAGGNTPPYSSWITAAHSIQDAVDAAAPGERVWVSNGIYSAGMRTVPGVQSSNRVVIDKPIRVESINGPQFTFIEGNGESESGLRCVYLAAGATLSGFTIEKGYADVESSIQTNFGGGVLAADRSATVSNCLFIGNRAIGAGGGFYGGTGMNCTFVSNSAVTLDGSSSLDDLATRGGAAANAALRDCTAIWNSCSHGGAFYGGSATRCTLISNSATFTGGGALDVVAEDCSFEGNYAQEGGGLHGGSALRCTFTANGAGWGAGANNAGLVYCRLIGNSAFHSGGGSHSGGSTGCVYTANYSVNGGGAWAGTHTHSTFTQNTGQNGILRAAWAYNCLVWDNTSSNLNLYDDGEVMSSEAFEGGWKQPWRGTTLYEPGLSTAWRLATNAISMGAGSIDYTLPLDIDGQPYRSPPTPGADEPYSTNCTGSLSVAIHPVSTQVFSETEIGLTARIEGAASGNEWDFGDGTRSTNQLVAHHRWLAAGTYAVTLRAWNMDEPGGVVSTATVEVVARPVYYVSPSGKHIYPYGSWESAATNIQSAIDAAPSNGGATVWVGDGVYNTGSTLAQVENGAISSPTRVVISKPIQVRSLNGPDVTRIEGRGPLGTNAVRCVYLLGICRWIARQPELHHKTGNDPEKPVLIVEIGL